MTLQETFDRVYIHLLTQNKKSENFMPDNFGHETFGCAYRGKDGAYCAIGCLIDDADYVSEMEGKRAVDEPVKSVLEKNGHNLNLCSCLQSIHDTKEVCQWKYELGNLARIFHLTL
jgi:hypothetical protein